MSDEYTPAMVTAAVERGAAWLDEHCPGWVTHIDLSRLDLGSQSACMLGQTAECLIGKPIRISRYTRVLSHLNAGTAWAIDHGFDVPSHWTELNARYEMLTIAWREYIRQRVETPA